MAYAELMGDEDAARRSADLTVATIDDPAQLDALEPEWNALLERSDATVFQSFEWQRTWWRHFGERRPDARLHVVTVRDADGLVAVAPLYVETTRVLGIVPLRRLLLVGHRDSDYLDVLAARGRERECAEAIAAHLAAVAGRLDVAVLEELPDRSRTAPALRAALLRRGWDAALAPDSPCPRTTLAATWDETLAAFAIEQRREVRRRLRNLGKEHAVELEVVSADPALEPAMREFVEMHQERWARDAYWGAFADPRQADFHADVAARLARRGWLFLAFLRVDGRRCTVNYGYAFRESIAIYLTGARAADDRLARHSPGRMVHALSMQRAIAEGRSVYDFMRGAEPYKYELGAVDVPNWRIVAFPRPGPLVRATHRLAGLTAALRRRAGREAFALRAAGRQGGWLAAPVRAHLARALRRALADLRRVLSHRSTP